MHATFLLAETPRGGPFGHRFIIPPDIALLSTEVETYFHRASHGQGSDFIAVTHQVRQHLPNGAVREGSETLLLTGTEIKGINDEQVKRIKQTLGNLLPDLEILVTKKINWEEAGQQTLIIRDELADWLDKDLADTLVRTMPPLRKGNSSQIHSSYPKDERTAMLIGKLLGLVVGAITLLVWFF